MPGLKDIGTASESLHFASKASRWLDEDYLIKGASTTDWARQFKLRHNWSKGSCSVHEVPVTERETVPPVLVQMTDGIVYTADKEDGLRAWATKGSRRRIAQLPCSRPGAHSPPTSIAVETSSTDQSVQRIAIGYEDGSFSVYLLSRTNGEITRQYSHGSSNGVITAIALCWPYVTTMTATQLLSLYTFPGHRSSSGSPAPPRLLHSLKSHSAWPPLSISLRTTISAIVVCVAYALPTYLSGWTVGLQEIKVCSEGRLLQSRVASAIDQHYRPLAFSSRPVMHHLASFANSSTTAPALELRHIHAKPTSLSYTHPYLLVSHPDNTLTLYLVTSNSEFLTVSAGSRLWGHTSAVSGAHVGGRGKAVSISRRGDELRVWELEGGFASSAARKRLATGDLSVEVKSRPLHQDEKPQAGLEVVHAATSDVSGSDVADDTSELTLTRGWIGFDEENVVVLKEHNQGKQALVVYDFT